MDIQQPMKTIQIKKDHHKVIRQMAAEQESSIKCVIAMIIDDFINSEQKINLLP